jgi:hypothetical protein
VRAQTKKHGPGSNGKPHHHRNHHHGPNPIAGVNADNEITAPKLILFSLSLLLLLHLSTAMWIDVIGGSTIGAIFAFYAAVVVGISLPLPSTAWIRTACVTIFHRAFELINPRCFCLRSGKSPRGALRRRLLRGRHVLAEQGLLRLGNSVAPGVALSAARAHGIAQHRHSVGGSKFSLLDSGAAVHSHVHHRVDEERSNPQNMVPEGCAGGSVAAVGPKPQSCAHSVLRPRLRFGASPSIGILLIDTVLRYSWLLRFWEKDLFPNADIYILSTQFLEALR